MKIRLSEKRRDRLPFTLLTVTIFVCAFAWIPTPWAFLIAFVGFAGVLWAEERVAIRRDQRDALHATAVNLLLVANDLARDAGYGRRADEFDWVPASVLAEAFPRDAEAVR